MDKQAKRSVAVSLAVIVALIIAVLIFSPGKAHSQTQGQNGLIWYIQSAQSRPTSTTSSWGYGVDPRAWNYDQPDAIVWYCGDANTDSAHGYSNLWTSTTAGQGDWTLRTGEPYYYWYNAGGRVVYDWSDTVRARAHKAGKKVILSLGGMWGAPATRMYYVFSDLMRLKRYIEWAVAYAKARGYDGIEIDYEWQGASTPSEGALSFYVTYLRQIWPTGMHIFTTYKTPSSNMDRETFEASGIIVMTMNYGYGATDPNGHHSAVRNSSFYPSTSRESWNSSGPRSWSHAGWSLKNVGVLLTTEMKSRVGPVVNGVQQNGVYGVTTGTNWANYECDQVIRDLIAAQGLTIQRDVQAGNVPYVHAKDANGKQVIYTFDDSISYAYKVAYADSLTPDGGVKWYGVWDAPRGVRSRDGAQKMALLTAITRIVKRGAEGGPALVPAPTCWTKAQIDSAFNAGRASVPACPPSVVCPPQPPPCPAPLDTTGTALKLWTLWYPIIFQAGGRSVWDAIPPSVSVPKGVRP